MKISNRGGGRGWGWREGAGINEIKDLQIIIDPSSMKLHKLCITTHIAWSRRDDIVCSVGALSVATGLKVTRSTC